MNIQEQQAKYLMLKMLRKDFFRAKERDLKVNELSKKQERRQRNMECTLKIFDLLIEYSDCHSRVLEAVADVLSISAGCPDLAPQFLQAISESSLFLWKKKAEMSTQKLRETIQRRKENSDE